jgi:hypothetical protein
MNVNLNEIILGNYGGIRVDAKVDEKLEDVKLIIEYDDHGDEFLIVKTKDNNIYEYGWYLNRKYTMDYDEVINSESDCGFIRKPKLFYKEDDNAQCSNDIFWRLRDWGIYDHMSSRVQKHSTMMAQHYFDSFVEFMIDDIQNRGIMYHHENDKSTLVMYLDENDILTQDNLDKLEQVKFDSRINGIDGFAGKRSLSIDDRIYGDDIQYIYYNGKFRDIKKTKKKHSYDNWGYKRFDLSLKQFR